MKFVHEGGGPLSHACTLSNLGHLSGHPTSSLGPIPGPMFFKYYSMHIPLTTCDLWLLNARLPACLPYCPFLPSLPQHQPGRPLLPSCWPGCPRLTLCQPCGPQLPTPLAWSTPVIPSAIPVILQQPVVWLFVLLSWS